MHQSLDCSGLNNPRQIMGMDYKLVVAVLGFFGMAAMMYKAPLVMVFPVVLLLVLRGPAKKDPAFVQVHMAHRRQREAYAPVYVVAKNQRTPRPAGFHRLMET